MTKYQNILIDKSLTAKDAIKKLDSNLEKIVFVVEENNKLVGSITDGDIRRWILKDGNLSAKVDEVCYKNTYYVNTNYDLKKVKKDIYERRIIYVPVVNEKKEIVEFLIWDKIFDSKIERKTKEKLNASIVIMAGGKGTRLEPFTRILPKPLIPIGDKSILEIIIEKFTYYGNDKFYISINHKSKIIKSYFEEIDPSYKINYIHEDKPLGTIGSLKNLEGDIDTDIILTNCDIIIEADYADLLTHHKEMKNDITIVASMKHYNIPYGICEIENGGQLVNIKEKPEYDFLVNTGMYVLKPEVLKYIPKDEFFHITDLIEKIKPTHKIGIYPISEKSWTDIGEWVEYKKTLEKFGL